MEPREHYRILVVDDNPAIHEDFQRILSAPGEVLKTSFETLDAAIFSQPTITTDLPPETAIQAMPQYSLEHAYQGKDALDLVKKTQTNQESPFSLAFVDVQMPPGWDGIETIRNIWQTDPWIQMVICTAYSDYSWDETIKQLGANDNLIILKKPFEVIEVRQLALSLSKKWQLNHQNQKHVATLEQTVSNRTHDLENSLALIRATLESTADGILIIDNNKKVVDYNKKFITMWKIPESVIEKRQEDEIISFTLNQLTDQEKFLEKTQFLHSNPDMESKDEITFKDGQIFTRFSIPHRVNNNIVGRVWSFRDVTREKKLQAELLYSATHDKLTNLPNRTLLFDRIKQDIAIAKRKNEITALLFLDLDGFKLVNDTHGHLIGDQFLKEVATRLKNSLREMDTIARLGGDEFVIQLCGLQDESQIKTVVKKILTTFRAPFQIGERNIGLSTSIGIALYPKDGDTAEVLLKNADTAVYSAKNHGRNTFQFYTPEISLTAQKRLDLESDLRRAIENKEFILVFQPLVNIESKKIIAVEALIRWQHPKLGLLVPANFIRLAEETGLILPIGEWVLRSACQQNKRWQDMGYKPIRVSVNVSSMQFKRESMDSLVKSILEETGLKPEYLELELTESIIIEEPKKMLETLNNLNALGVDLVIDDFGIGYSNFNYLKNFPVKRLKIDQTFIKDLPEDFDDKTIVQSIVTMANNLKMKVVAEGAETKEQFSFLKDIKCEEVQGYLLSKPLLEAEISKLLKEDVVFKNT